MGTNYKAKTFTMIEAISVIIMISILTALSATSFTRRNVDVLTESALIKSHLRFVQSLAMKDDTATPNWGIAFDNDTNGDGNDGDGTYSLVGPTAATVVFPGYSSASKPFDGMTITVNFGVTPVSGNTIRFDPFGEPVPAVAGDYTITIESIADSQDSKTLTINTGGLIY